MKLRWVVAAFVALVAAVPARAAETDINGVTIIDPWSCAGDTVIYMDIQAPADVGDRLMGAGVAIAERVEIDTYVWEYGVLRLRPIEAINIAPDEVVQLKPGGHHLRLMELAEPLVPGTEFDLELVFANAGEGIVTVPVVDCAPEPPPTEGEAPPPPEGYVPPPPEEGYVPPPLGPGIVIPVPWPGSY